MALIQQIDPQTQTIQFPTSDAGTTCTVNAGTGTKATGANVDAFVLTPGAADTCTQYKFDSVISGVTYSSLIEVFNAAAAAVPSHPGKEPVVVAP